MPLASLTLTHLVGDPLDPFLDDGEIGQQQKGVEEGKIA
jgi:hypothetical protein